MPFFFAPNTPRRGYRRPATNKPTFRAPPPVYAAPVYYKGRGRYRRATDPAMVARRNQRTDNFIKVAKALKEVLPSPERLIKTYTGFGDYQVKTNSIMQDLGVTSSGIVPVVSNIGSQRSVRMRHREFITDVQSSTTFVNSSYQINPANASCFPWLSNIAQNFQEYRFHGLIFTFKSTSADALNSTNTALGTVIMSTDYNAGNTPFANKAQAENSEFTISCKPSENMLHGVECDPSITVNQGHLFISPSKNGTVPLGQDIKTYNMGNFQFMTVGSQAVATIGELHVSYDIELIKPIQLQNTYDAPWFGYYGLGATALLPLGGEGLGSYTGTLECNLDFTSGSQSLTLPESSILGDRYLIEMQYQGEEVSAGNFVPPTFSMTGCAFPVFEDFKDPDKVGPICIASDGGITYNTSAWLGGTASTYGIARWVVEITSSSAPFTIDFVSPINLPTGEVAVNLTVSCCSV